MHKYKITINWSEENQFFIAEVPELPGCMAHGNTQEAALENIKEATELWLETAREFDDPIPEPQSKKIAI